MNKLWIATLTLLVLAGCQGEPISRLELRRTHYVLPPPVTSTHIDPGRRLALEAEWPAPYTVMRPAEEDVVRVRQDRWVQCDDFGRSFRLDIPCDDVGVVRVNQGYYPRPIQSCDQVIYNNRAFGSRLSPCQGRARPRVGGYGAPVVVRVPQGRQVGPPPIVIIRR